MSAVREEGVSVQASVTLRRVKCLLHRNVERFRGGLVFKAHRRFASLTSRLESNKEERRASAQGRDHPGCRPEAKVTLKACPARTVKLHARTSCVLTHATACGTMSSSSQSDAGPPETAGEKRSTFWSVSAPYLIST